MPYIEEAARARVAELGATTIGELNFEITTACLDYLSRGGESYAAYNGIIGALECAKLEMYRRMVAPYEDKKKEDNGDVY